MRRTVLILVLLLSSGAVNGQNLLRSSDGFLRFVSDAPLERITASSSLLQGVIDKSALTFAFSVQVNSLKGFNSPLQQEHFYENYMETDQYPKATFSGKIIETVSLNEKGSYDLRGKGVLNIHGVKQNRIIKVKVDVDEKGVRITSEFEVELKDHNIKIPRIVNQKIAPVINVFTDIYFKTDEQ